MIPAILSCVFVIYLYQTLNESAETQAADGTENSGNDRGAGSLTARLDALQGRLDRLAGQIKKGTDA